MGKIVTTSTVLREIYESLNNAGELLLLWCENPHTSAFQKKLNGEISNEKWNQIFSEQKKRKALERMRKKQWIDYHAQGDHIIFTLSHDPIALLIKTNIVSTKNVLPSEQQLLVIFDFPEAARRARNSFRAFLKKAGFKQKQLSVWISQKNCVDELKKLIKLSGTEKWVEAYLIQE